MLTLRGIPFGKIFNAPGARGFFGECHSFHLGGNLMGLPWKGTNFIAKTTTWEPCKGNMPLRADGITPREFMPRCIAVNFKDGHVVNAVGLSGPGSRQLFLRGHWFRMTTPFMLSFMAVRPTREGRLEELREFKKEMQVYGKYLPEDIVAIQLNRGCPNTGTKIDEQTFVEETWEQLEEVSGIDRPVVVNTSPTISVDTLCDIAIHPSCAAVSPTNTVPWGQDSRIPWDKLFVRAESEDWDALWRVTFNTHWSPLMGLKGLSSPGGLSSPLVAPIGIELIRQAKEAGIRCPVIGGAGTQDAETAIRYLEAGADALAIGVISTVRPRNMRRTIGSVLEHEKSN